MYPFDDFLGNIMGEQMSKPFELLLGRKTFDIFASYWPHHEDQWPGINKVMRKFAESVSPQIAWLEKRHFL